MNDDRNNTQPARRSDLCRLFEREAEPWYTLALLLTADCDLAEQCFVSAAAECLESASPVLQSCIRAWGKHVLIRQAIRAAATEKEPNRKTLSASKTSHMDSILMLGRFERFVFVISVLERYSDMDCCLLLDCTRRELQAARSRAFLKLAAKTGGRRNLPAVWHPAPAELKMAN